MVFFLIKVVHLRVCLHTVYEQYNGGKFLKKINSSVFG